MEIAYAPVRRRRAGAPYAPARRFDTAATAEPEPGWTPAEGGSSGPATSRLAEVAPQPDVRSGPVVTELRADGPAEVAPSGRSRSRPGDQGLRVHLNGPRHDVVCEVRSMDLMGIRCTFAVSAASPAVASDTPTYVTLVLDSGPFVCRGHVRWARTASGTCELVVILGRLRKRQRAALAAYLRSDR